MSSNSLFKTILSKHPPVRNIFLHSNSDTLLLIAYVANTIHISKFSLEDGAIKDLKHDFNGEKLKIENTVNYLFFHDDKFYVVDDFGVLFTITTVPVSDPSAEYDLFEDSPEKSESWTIKKVADLLNGLSVLSTCFLDEEGELAVLTGSEAKITLEIFNISDGNLTNTFLARSPGIAKDQNKNKSLLMWVPGEKLVDDFVKNWFTKAREKRGFFLIALSDGMILALFPSTADVEYLYHWPYPYVACRWDHSSDPDCEAVQFCSLSLISANGGVLKMSEVGEALSSYFPANNIKNAFIDGSDILYITDWINSYRFSLSSSSEQSIMLPLKGILCWGGWGTRYTLALSKNGEVYCIDNNYDFKDIPQILPDSSLTEQLIRKTEALEQINSTISKMDEYLQASCLVNKHLKFLISAQSAYVRRREYTVCLKIKCLTSGVTIDRKSWLLAASVRGGTSHSLTTCHKLRQDIQSEATLTQFVSFRLWSHHLSHLTLIAKLFYNSIPPLVTYLPVIFIGEIFMDPSNFILPAVELESPALCLPDIDSLLKNGKSDNREDTEKNNITLHITLSENFPADSAFKNLLSKCKTLWRTSLWNKACEEKELQLAIANQLVTVEISEGSVKISGINHEACHIMKHALFSSAPKGCHFKLNLTDAVNKLELYERSCELFLHMEDPPIENIQETHQLLRKNITSQLTF